MNPLRIVEPARKPHIGKLDGRWAVVWADRYVDMRMFARDLSDAFDIARRAWRPL